MTWIFGYGSLAWRPGFDYNASVTGYIKDYRRVFWQGSTDHRGTPEAPGRTVTLHEAPGAVTWGVAFQLSGTEEEQQQTIKYLEWREKQYDVRRLCDIFTADSPDAPAVQDALVYIATDSPSNVNWLGPAPLEAIAQQICTAVGPSGRNDEYLYRLADFMRKISVDDQELFHLEKLVRTLLAPSMDITTLLFADTFSHLQPHNDNGARMPTALASGASQSDIQQNRKEGKQPTSIQLQAIATMCG